MTTYVIQHNDTTHQWELTVDDEPIVTRDTSLEIAIDLSEQLYDADMADPLMIEATAPIDK